MNTLRTTIFVGAAILAIAAPIGIAAQSQSTELHIRFNSGQSIVPVYEGFERRADGSFDMVFGYMNRNHVQELSIPVGAQNSFEPGPADRGQPTYFYPRENHFLFRVNIPKGWDKNREVIWTVTANGKTEKARATLLDVWEIDRKVEVSNTGGGTSVSNALLYKDQPPSITINPISTAPLRTPVAFSASVTDDGIPDASVKPRPRPEPEPTFQRPKDAEPTPVNVPLPERPKPAKSGLSVLWLVWRGPAGVQFEPEGYIPVKDGKVSVNATFTQPGTYVIRAYAHDTLLKTPADVTVTVPGGPSTSQGQ